MSAGEDDSEKEFEPTEKRLSEARERGEVPRSPELTTAAAYAGLLIAAIALGGPALTHLANAGLTLIEQPDRLATLLRGNGTPPTGGLIGAVLGGIAPFFVLPVALVLAALTVQRAFTVTPDKLLPKLARISPLATARNKFGRSGLFEFAKSLLKLLLVSLILGLFLASRMPEILTSMALAPGQITTLFLRLLIQFLFLILILTGAMGAVDYLWQRHEHLRRNRMSRKEMMDELKQSEGDPHMKQTRRQRGQEIALNRMLADVPKADVILVNPTHYAVALRWDRASGRAPHCVAKGVDEVAARIREAAAEAGVPIHSDPPTARALFATVEIGQEIPPDHYRPVAAAIRFAEAMRQRARHRPY